jgi:DNA-binding response OmpR family regulator
MASKILVVDDTETMRAYHEKLLTAAGYEVESAKNGEEGLEKISRLRPDLVLLDIDMPVMDGLTCCRSIKTAKSLASIKVIMVTSRTEYDKISQAFKAGCDDYVTKPVNKEELLGKIAELLRFVALRKMIDT